MKTQALLMGLAISAFTAPAFADHASENRGSTAQLAYRLADTAESLERYSRGDIRGGGFINNEKTENGAVEAQGQEPLDHRDQNLGQLCQVARRLHLAASDLYRAARWNGGGVFPNSQIEKSDEGGSTINDHAGDGIRNVYDRVRFEYQNMRRFYANLAPYVIDQNIHYLVRDIDQAYSNLEWSVYGIRQ